jgi:hypothetical protein
MKSSRFDINLTFKNCINYFEEEAKKISESDEKWMKSFKNQNVELEKENNDSKQIQIESPIFVASRHILKIFKRFKDYIRKKRKSTKKIKSFENKNQDDVQIWLKQQNFQGKE